MKTPLTIQLIVKNNEETIDFFLESIAPLGCNIIAADLGCKDGTIKKLENKNATIIKTLNYEDMSKVRNKLILEINSEWILHLEPYETLISDSKIIKEAIKGPPSSFNFGVLQGDMLTRQTRLWHKSLNLSYVNPIYETIERKSNFMNFFINVNKFQPQVDVKSIAKNWHDKNPLLADATYYVACNELISKNWDAFINFADLYLHQQKKQTMSYFMIQYYMAMVQCYIKKNYQIALQRISMCVLKNPTLAEFWCLLGDIFYAIKQYDKSYCFYENAKIIGSRRLQECDWPMEISKYHDYPTKMMESCRKILNNTQTYLSNQ
jgi:tetratricopeptide (TPR) repeat protein